MELVYAGQILIADHIRMDKVLKEIYDADQAREAQAPASGRWTVMEDSALQKAAYELRAKWVKFEESLTNHFQTEETFVLPVLRQVNPGEAAALLTEHNRLRALLSEIGTGVNLSHSPIAARFFQELASHAYRENALMYPWANTNLPQQTVDLLRTRLQRTFPDLGTVITL
jgi:iron-sulfur cluster repair protein YtfE (RIC family)